MNLERETDGRLFNWCLRDREADPIQSDVITEKHTQKMNMNETRVNLITGAKLTNASLF